MVKPCLLLDKQLSRPDPKIAPCTNCGMAPMHRDIALAKLRALGMGAALARERHGDKGDRVGQSKVELATLNPT